MIENTVETVYLIDIYNKTHEFGVIIAQNIFQFSYVACSKISPLGSLLEN